MAETLQAIEELLNRREVKKAEISIARGLRGDLTTPERVSLLLLRVRARLLTARFDDALDDLKRIRAISPETFELPSTLELWGDCHFARFELASVGFADRADTVQAVEAYHRIVNDFPNYENLGWIYYQWARVLLTENHVEQAVETFQRALLSPSRVPALTAYCYERLGFVAFYEWRDSKRALAFLNKAVDTYPASETRLWLVGVHTLRGRVLREMRDHPLALEAVEKAITVAEASGHEGRVGLADASLTAGEILTEMAGREKEVILYLQQFLQNSRKPLGIDVTWSRVHEMLGDAYFKTNQHQQAINAYLAALQFNPYHPWEVSLNYRIARSHYQLADYDRAIHAIQRAIQVAKDDGQTIHDYRIFNILASAQFALRQYEQARQSYEKALEIAPPNGEGIDKLRHYLQKARELSGAV